MGKLNMNTIQHDPKVTYRPCSTTPGSAFSPHRVPGEPSSQAVTSKRPFACVAPGTELPTEGSRRAHRHQPASSAGSPAPNARNTGRGDATGSSQPGLLLVSLWVSFILTLADNKNTSKNSFRVTEICRGGTKTAPHPRLNLGYCWRLTLIRLMSHEMSFY